MKTLTEHLTEGLLNNVGVGLEVEMMRWCDEMHLENYSIVDGKINIDGSVDYEFSTCISKNKLTELPYPFGVIEGDFVIKCYYGGMQLRSLNNFPEEVKRNFAIIDNNYIKSLKGAPQKIGGDLDCSVCKNLTSLEGCPKEIGGNFRCKNCDKLKTLAGAPKKVLGFFVEDCPSLESLNKGPVKVDWNYSCSGCTSLTSLEGVPDHIGGNFRCMDCTSLTSLEGAPKKVSGDFNCSNCENLLDVGTPFKVVWVFYYRNCPKLKLPTNFKKMCGKTSRGKWNY